MESATAAPGLSDEQRAEFLRLTRGADSVELKLTVPAAEAPQTGRALGVDPLEAQIRQVFFFDTPELALYENGVVVRARRVQDRGDDSVVKLRPVVPDELPDELRAEREFGVEVDAMPGGFVCSGSMKHAIGEDDHVRQTFLDGRPLHKLFSEAQKALYAEHAPEGLELDDLATLGPIFVLKMKFRPPELADRKMVAEFWLYPDYSAVVELSTKCAPSEAFQVAAEARSYLFERGVDLSGEQETKTRKALEYFSQRVTDQA